MTVSQTSAGSISSVTYFDHDHRKRENVRLFIVWPSVQDLWRGPSRGAVMMGGAPNGIHGLSDSGEAEISDACMTGVVHKDVLLTES